MSLFFCSTIGGKIFSIDLTFFAPLKPVSFMLPITSSDLASSRGIFGSNAKLRTVNLMVGVEKLGIIERTRFKAEVRQQGTRLMARVKGQEMVMERSRGTGSWSTQNG